MNRTSELTTDSAADLARLEAIVGRCGSLLVAYSGGVDSAVLLAAAVRALGDRAVAVTADSPSMPRRELEAAGRVAAGLGARHLVVATREIERDEYVRNDASRCYWCKHTLFETCEEIARRDGFAHIAYGYTADDVGDFRPGHRAAAEFGVHAPLLEAGLGKEQIRAIARLLALDVWDKPAAPCLASRIPHGSVVTEEKLSRIERMEELLRELGFRICRARHDGTIMRIELEPDDIPRATDPEVRRRILALGSELGVGLVVLDLEGFRSGKLSREVQA